jgi:hypothetical protein
MRALAQSHRPGEVQRNKPPQQAAQQIPRTESASSRFAHDFTGVPAHSSLPFLETIQKSFGHHDLSDVRAERSRDAWSMGAEAFTRGSEVSFARTPTLHTAAHEAAHVVQQRAGVTTSGENDVYERQADAVADRVTRGQSSEDLLAGNPRVANPSPVTQLRRIPPNVRALLTSSTGGKGQNFDANMEGVVRLIQQALDELTPVERKRVDTAALGGLTQAAFDALSLLERRSRYSEAILKEFPGLELGDPKLIDSGARPLTTDAANVTKVVGEADKLFTDIASGARDTWLKDVFGAGSIATAKTRYAAARTRMHTLHLLDRIVTDRSGYSEEVSQGGLTDSPGGAPGTIQKIRVEKDVIDSPLKKSSAATLLHESMHAGNASVGDQYDGFDTEIEANKVGIASCYEVVAWRILDKTNPMAFFDSVTGTFKVFIPAGTTVGGVTAPALTKVEQGAKAARELYREAWTTGLNLHPFYVQVFNKPTDWTLVGANPDFPAKKYDNSLPYWSKVQRLTIHKKTAIDPTSADKAKHPVSQIDLALSETVNRKLAAGMFMTGPLQKEPDILAFETANATAPELAPAILSPVHADVTKERDFLLKLTTRHKDVNPITGNVARDLRVVKELGLLSWGSVLDARNPSTFAD